MSTNNYYNITNRHRNTGSTNYHVFHRIIYAFVLLLSIGGLPAVERVESVPLVVDKRQTKSREPITLEEAFLGELRAKDFDFDWLSTKGSGDSELNDQLIYDDFKNILLVTLPSIERRNATNFNIPSPGATPPKNQQILTNFEPNVTVLVSNSSLLSTIEFQGYKLSPSKQYLLLWNSRRKQFRHSFTAKYFLYDIKRDLVSLLSTKQSQGQPQPTSATYSPSFEDENEYMRFKVVDWYSTETPQGLVDSLIMIQNNDIYKLYDVSRLVVDTQNLSSTDSKRDLMVSANHALPTRLTYTGKEGVIFNGVPDWLYEEEILGDTPAFQVSPLSSHLAYMSFDDSHVNIMPYTIYGDRVIPRVQLLRYPKTGQPNPQVTVRIIENFSHLNEVESKSNNGVQMIMPDDLGHEQHYINRIKWLTNEKLALILSSRNQSNSFVIICSMLPGFSVDSSAQWNCEKNLNMKAENGWLDIGDDLLPLNADYYLALVPKFEGAEVGNFKHIAKVSIKEPNKFIYLTSGRKEVISFNGVDYKRSLVYYTSTVAHEPGQRQLFVTELDSTSTHKNITLDVLEASSTSVCVTCDHHPDECLYNFAKMSPSTNYYMFHCAGPGVPRVELRATRRRRHRNFFENLVNDARQQKFLNHPAQGNESNVLAGDGSNGQNSPSLLWTFEDNRKLRDKLENHKLMPLTLRATIPIDGTGYQADALILLPPNLFGSGRPQSTNKLRTSSSKYLTLEQIKESYSVANNGQQLPMVVDVYGGPGSQKVDYRFGINFGHYLASSKQIVYIMIDGRGSGYQGSKRLYELYHKLGTVEIQDQIDVASHLAHFLWFIDPTKVAIWGWSYGGYVAAMSLVQSKLRANNEQAHNQKLVQNQTDPGIISGSVFKCAASVAPVTNWIYYDTAYTEKYMSSPWVNEKYDNLYPGDHLYNNEVVGRQPVLIQSPTSTKRDPFVANKWTPLNQTLNSAHIHSTTAQHFLDLIADTETNRDQRVSSLTTNQQQVNNKNQIDLNDRYRKASLLEQAANFDSNSFLLIHGTADDNVNFQQSIMLMKRFIKKNVLFETRLYPDQDHGIAEKADKFHLGSTLSDFLIGCLGRV